MERRGADVGAPEQAESSFIDAIWRVGERPLSALPRPPRAVLRKPCGSCMATGGVRASLSKDCRARKGEEAPLSIDRAGQARRQNDYLQNLNRSRAKRAFILAQYGVY